MYRRGIVIDVGGMTARLVWQADELAQSDELFSPGLERQALKALRRWGAVMTRQQAGERANLLIATSLSQALPDDQLCQAEASLDGGRSWCGFERVDEGRKCVWRNRLAFRASHEQSHLPESHACHRLHGHGYLLAMRHLSSLTDDDEAARVALNVERTASLIARSLDDRSLNEALASTHTSSECVCRWVAEWLQREGADRFLRSVALRETPKIWAEHVIGGDYRISKDYHFSASRLLKAEDGNRLTGDNYVVRLVMRSSVLDAFGFAFDLADLKPFERLVAERLDHRHLDDALDGGTSPERMARWLHDAAVALFPEASVHQVHVIESSGSWSAYGGERMGLDE